MASFSDLADVLEAAAAGLDERGKEALIIGLAAMLRQITAESATSIYLDAAVGLTQNLMGLPPRGRRKRRNGNLRIMPQ